VPQSPKHHHRDNASANPKCHADDPVKLDAVAADGTKRGGEHHLDGNRAYS
jgi:hypothetical protein